MEFQITSSRSVGGVHPVFVIAEVGNNHQGRMDLALASIDAAAKAGADAVSFQYAPIGTYVIRELHHDPRVQYLKECEFTFEQLATIRDRVRSHGLAFSINVEDTPTLDKVLGLGMDFVKICSADLTNVPFLEDAAARRKPIFFSTGGAYLEEIDVAYEAMKRAGLSDYVVYHTNSGYPTPIEEAHLLQMDVLHDRYGGVKGYCDHTVEVIPSVAAVARGAKVIEKHISTSRALRGDDWMVSLEPDEFSNMVAMIRDVEKTFGSREKAPRPHETATRTFKRKSIVSARPIAAGSVITRSDLTFKVPGDGIAPTELTSVVGRRAKVAIPEDVLVTRKMFE